MTEVTNKRIQRIKEKIRFEQAKLRKAQEECPHNAGEFIYRSNAGGYDDPMYDKYWINCACTVCGLCWTVDQNTDEYYSITRRKSWIRVMKS